MLCQEGLKVLLADAAKLEEEPVLTDYPANEEHPSHDHEYGIGPIQHYRREVGKLLSNKLDREIMAQYDEMREDRADEELKDALNHALHILDEADVPEEDRHYILPKTDMVNSPSHYLFGEDGQVECVDAIRAALTEDEFRGWCKGNAMKYIWRSNHKGTRDQDLQKCAWFSRFAAGEDPRE